MRNPTILTVSKIKRYFGTVSFQAPNKLDTVQFSIISQTSRSTVNSKLLELEIIVFLGLIKRWKDCVESTPKKETKEPKKESPKVDMPSGLNVQEY